MAACGRAQQLARVWDVPVGFSRLHHGAGINGEPGGTAGLLGDCRRCRSVTAEVKADFVSLVEI